MAEFCNQQSHIRTKRKEKNNFCNILLPLLLLLRWRFSVLKSGTGRLRAVELGLPCHGKPRCVQLWRSLPLAAGEPGQLLVSLSTASSGTALVAKAFPRWVADADRDADTPSHVTAGSAPCAGSKLCYLGN